MFRTPERDFLSHPMPFITNRVNRLSSNRCSSSAKLLFCYLVKLC